MKHRSYFLRWGTVREMSLISSSTGSAAAESAPCTPSTLPAPTPFRAGEEVWPLATSTRLRLAAGWSSVGRRSDTKEAISLKRVMRAGESREVVS